MFTSVSDLKHIQNRRYDAHTKKLCVWLRKKRRKEEDEEEEEEEQEDEEG